MRSEIYETNEVQPSNELKTQAEADSEAYTVFHDDSDARTDWFDGDGSPISGGTSRAFALQHDVQHPESPKLGYSTPHSQHSADQRRWVETVRFSFRQYSSTPHFVEEDDAVDMVNRMDSAPELSPYGGVKLLTAVAITELARWSDEEVFSNDEFRTEFREEVGDGAQVTSGKALRKMFELRGDE